MFYKPCGFKFEVDFFTARFYFFAVPSGFSESVYTMPSAPHNVLKFSSSETASSGTIVSTKDR